MTAYVTRSFFRQLVTLGAITLSVLLSFSWPAAAGQEQSGDPPALIGRLATVEPSTRRITMIREGDVDLIELFVSDDAVVELGDRQVTLTQLVIEAGRRITVNYRLDGERRVAVRIIVVLE